MESIQEHVASMLKHLFMLQELPYCRQGVNWMIHILATLFCLNGPSVKRLLPVSICY